MTRLTEHERLAASAMKRALLDPSRRLNGPSADRWLPYVELVRCLCWLQLERTPHGPLALLMAAPRPSLTFDPPTHLVGTTLGGAS